MRENIVDKAKDAVIELTGLCHPVFVQSGTAALQLAISVLTNLGDSVSIPALSCWGLTAAVIRSERRPVFHDVDRFLGSILSQEADAAIVMDPWGCPTDWGASSKIGRCILDATLSPSATFQGSETPNCFDAVVYSLGRGKPLDVGAGGVVVFRERAMAHSARQYVLFGVSGSSWAFVSDRYVFAPGLYGPFLERVNDLPRRRERVEAGCHLLSTYLALEGLPLELVDIRPDSRRGAASVYCLTISPSLNLSSEELFLPLLLAGLPVVDQWVTPAYLQPAIRLHDAPACTDAEALAPRLLFFTDQITEPTNLEKLGRVLAAVRNKPDWFKQPFQSLWTAAEPNSVPAHWIEYGRLGRAIDGRCFVLDQLNGKFYAVDDRTAATLQACKHR